jgi:hypothetical protein
MRLWTFKGTSASPWTTGTNQIPATRAAAKRSENHKEHHHRVHRRGGLSGSAGAASLLIDGKKLNTSNRRGRETGPLCYLRCLMIGLPND